MRYLHSKNPFKANSYSMDDEFKKKKLKPLTQIDQPQFKNTLF